jgi:hypothetical protein
MHRLVFTILIVCTMVFSQEVGARYLIITYDDFYNAVQPLAQWKQRKGLRTKVVKLSEIGTSATQIKNFIENAYNTWQIRPEYLLLVGAPNYIPFYYCDSVYTPYYSDNYYTNMDSDVENEILSGRLTVHDATEAQTVINKILLYEKTPDTSDSSWFTNACLIVRECYDYHDDSIYWSDINYAKDLMRNHGYGIIDTLSRSAGDSASDVMTSVNAGRAFVLYRGSGSNNWAYPFDGDPDQAANGTKLPIVLSITCRGIGLGSTPAIVERWLLTGTPSQPEGAAGYFASLTIIEYGAHLRSAISKAFFNALFLEGKRTFGEACEYGRLNVLNLYGSTSEYRSFTTLGDPEMNIWTATPRQLDVSHASQLCVNDESLVVHVQCQNSPVESALVCVLLDSLVYEYGYTNFDGEIALQFDTLCLGTMHVTVTAQNKIPYLGSIQVISVNVGETIIQEVIGLSEMEVSPNPFSAQTYIKYTIDEKYAIDNKVFKGTSKYNKPEIRIYDAIGRLVRSFEIVPGALRTEKIIIWNGRDEANRTLSSGVYFIRAISADKDQSIPVILLK